MSLSRTSFLAAVPVLLLGASLTSCSVKEDRMDCPCILTIDISECENSPVLKVRNITENQASGKPVMSENNDSDLTQSFQVKKGRVLVSAYSLLRNMYEQDELLLMIPKGQQCDELYAFSEILSCREDEKFQKIQLHKQFCTLSIIPTGWEGDEFPYSLMLKGTTSGISLWDLSPVPGEFLCSAKWNGSGQFQANIPRQGSDDLELIVLDKGEFVRSFPIGKLIADSGFDWDAMDLDDITLSIDFTRIDVSVLIRGWGESHEDVDI